MKKLSDKALKWIRICHMASVYIWAAFMLLVIWFGIAKIPMIISLVIMNVLLIIRSRNER